MKNFQRLLNLPKNKSFFLFGARGTGKSTLIQNAFKSPLYIDLLNINEERKYHYDPQQLEQEVLALPKKTTHIVIDEIQKIPDLLNVVHSLIEKTEKVFVLTGSSARKLKHGHANLLAGRAVVRNLFPLSAIELGNHFTLTDALTFGTLPKVQHLKSSEAKIDFLRAYAHIYLKEEVWAEHLIRKLEPFQYFLEVAAQCNGSILNLSNIAKDVGVDDKSIAQYFSILEDTLLGYHLPAYRKSFRKRLIHKPKFYFFDLGVTRALQRTLTIPLKKQTYEYGNLFEQFVLLECLKLGNYFHPDFRFSYLRTYDDIEIDLIVERPGLPLLCIEIKSAEKIEERHLNALHAIQKEYGKQAEYVCFANVKEAEKLDDILVYPWQEGIRQYFMDAIETN